MNPNLLKFELNKKVFLCIYLNCDFFLIQDAFRIFKNAFCVTLRQTNFNYIFFFNFLKEKHFIFSKSDEIFSKKL